MMERKGMPRQVFLPGMPHRPVAFRIRSAAGPAFGGDPSGHGKAQAFGGPAAGRKEFIMAKNRKHSHPRTIREVEHLIHVVERLRFSLTGFSRLAAMAQLYCEGFSGDLLDSAWVLLVDGDYVTYDLFGRRTFTREDFLMDKHAVIDGLTEHINRLREHNRAAYARRRSSIEADRCTPCLMD